MTIDEKHLTIEEFHEFIQRPENQERSWELVEGVIIEMPSSSKINTIIAGLFIHFLNIFVLERGLGYVTGPDGGYRLGPNTIRQPDAAFIAKDRVENLEGVSFSVAPDLAIEVVSPSESPSDIRKKINDYLSAGTKQVWAVYPEDKVIDIWQLAEDGSKNVHTVDINGTLDGGEILPGFKLEAKQVFPE